MTESEPSKKVPLVIGGGICGLAIAWRFYEKPENQKQKIRIIEQEKTPGGLARSISLGDQKADMGPHRLHTEIDEVDEFLDRYAGEEIEVVNRQSQMYLRGKWIEYPPKPLEILGVFGPVRLSKVFLSFAQKLLGLSKKYEDDSFEAVMTGAFGAELYRLIVLGYTKKVWKIPPSQIHGDIARVRVSAGGLQQLVKRVFVPEKKGQETALKKFRYLPGGVETLVTKMSADLKELGTEIDCNEKLIDLYRENDEWNVVTKDGDGVEKRNVSDTVYSTIPVTDLCRVLLKRNPDEKVSKALEGCRFIANFLVVLHVDQDRISRNQWLYFPGKETIFNRGYEPRNFSDTMGKPGSTLLILEITCYENDRIWKASDHKLINRTIRELDKIGFVPKEKILDTSVVRIPKTYPLYDLEYRERMNTIWDYLRQFEGLISVGRQGLFLHNNMDHSIHMGFRAVDHVIKKGPAASRTWYDNVSEFQQFRIVD